VYTDRVTRSDKSVPKQIDRYTIKRRLGRGGAGTVYLAEDPELKRDVAIKILHKSIMSDKQHVDRFKREARVMARISSPYVAAVYQVGEHKSVPFIVMEYLGGENLEVVLKRNKRISVLAALGYLRDVCLGLESAFASEVIHRDIKPANIVVEGAGAKITDFGIARALDGEKSVTLAGQIAGTASFMSPERVKGQKEDFRSDIYSLGATLYTLLCGVPPFIDDNPMNILTAHLDKKHAPMQHHVSDMPKSVEALVSRMLKKEPRERFDSYAALIEETHRILKALGAEEMTGRFIPPPTVASQLMPEEEKQKPTGVMGDLEQMSVIEIMQLLELGKKNAEVNLTSSDKKDAHFGVYRGKVIYAKTAFSRGEKAFYDIVAMQKGSFQIQYGVVPKKKNVDRESTFLLIEAMRRLDEKEQEMPAALTEKTIESKGEVSEVEDEATKELSMLDDDTQAPQTEEAGPFGEATAWAPEPDIYDEVTQPPNTLKGVEPHGAPRDTFIERVKERAANEAALLSNILNSDDDAHSSKESGGVRVPWLTMGTLTLLSVLLIIAFSLAL